ncbi:hypothetical protein ACS5NO_19275 [Larkinella sp. GY13]|uniref:hypothetical protein n=1 Tax=Larkinella sp. GY13 TaxID=3453720 RepID=UPI003EEF1F1A
MRTGIYLIFCLLLGLTLGCESNFEDVIDSVYKDGEINGTVYLNDTFTDAPIVIAPEATIYLTATGSATTYLISTTAVSDGKFTFSHQPATENFYVVGRFKNKEGIQFEKVMSYTDFKNDPKLLLEPQYPGGKIKVRAVNSANQPIFGADILLFINQEQAESIAGTAPAGQIRQKTTNEKGNVFFYDLPAGDYYLAGKKDLLVTSPTAVTVSQSNVNSFTTVQTTPASLTLTIPTELTVTVRDLNSDPVAGATVYVFSSRTQAASITTTSPAAIGSKITDKKGEAKISGLTAGTTYYIDAKATFTVNNTAQERTNSTGPVSATRSQPVSLTL